MAMAILRTLQPQTKQVHATTAIGHAEMEATQMALQQPSMATVITLEQHATTVIGHVMMTYILMARNAHLHAVV